MDSRHKHPRLSPPIGRSYNPIAVTLNDDDYRKFYAVVMHHGVAGAETLRRLIRKEYDEVKEDAE